MLHACPIYACLTMPLLCRGQNFIISSTIDEEDIMRVHGVAWHHTWPNADVIHIYLPQNRSRIPPPGPEESNVSRTRGAPSGYAASKHRWEIVIRRALCQRKEARYKEYICYEGRSKRMRSAAWSNSSRRVKNVNNFKLLLPLWHLNFFPKLTSQL